MYFWRWWPPIGGRTVKTLRRYDFGAVSAINPDVSILEIGTNDLVANCPELVVSEIDDVVQLLQQSYSKRVIRVCEVIPCRADCILIRALTAPVCLELEPLLLWFHFISGLCCCCMFWIRALVALVLLCLVLVELKPQCYRAYMWVRNTYCAFNMSWSVLPFTFLFWGCVILYVVSPTRLFGQQNPELVSVTRVFLVFFRQQPETTLKSCLFDFRIPSTLLK